MTFDETDAIDTTPHSLVLDHSFPYNISKISIFVTPLTTIN